MVIVSKRNIIITSPDGKTSFFVPKNYIGSIPKWAEQTAYFHALVNDGKLAVSQSKKDSDIDKASEKPVTDNAQRKKKPEK